MLTSAIIPERDNQKEPITRPDKRCCMNRSIMCDAFRRYNTCASMYKGAGINTFSVVGRSLPQLANNAVPCHAITMQK
jgi:hypothetical protein